VPAPALAPDGTLVDDFIMNSLGGMLLVRNAPSPTASLAIAEMIADTARSNSPWLRCSEGRRSCDEGAHQRRITGRWECASVCRCADTGAE